MLHPSAPRLHRHPRPSPRRPHTALLQRAMVAGAVIFIWSNLALGPPCGQQLQLGGERFATSSFPVLSVKLLGLTFCSNFVVLIASELPTHRCF